MFYLIILNDVLIVGHTYMKREGVFTQKISKNLIAECNNLRIQKKSIVKTKINKKGLKMKGSNLHYIN